MNICPVCRSESEVKPPSWSGGRIHVRCEVCGELEIGNQNYEELLRIPADDNDLSWLRGCVERYKGHRLVISKNRYDVFGADPTKERLTKMDKRRILSDAESKPLARVQIVYNGSEDEGGT